ncbi:MAG: hypothetical protein Q9227_008982 [Pyrenula ochraceoflavens]
MASFYVPVAAALCIGYVTAVAAYRLYFHPLARFPGPRLAALTTWYEGYYDIWLKGRYIWKIRELHEQHQRGDLDAMFETLNHDLHRKRRIAASSFFSKRSIQALEPVLRQKTDELIQLLEKESALDRVINFQAAYTALTMDIVSQYCFGESMGSLEKEKYGRSWMEFFHSGVHVHPIARQFSYLFDQSRKMPGWLATKVSPMLGLFTEYNEMIKSKLRQGMQPGVKQVKPETPQQRTIFHELLASNLPPSEKTVDRLAGEALIVLGAGTETTARTLSNISFWITSNPSVLQRLRQELDPLMDGQEGPVTVAQLEKLPYLTAIIQEGLRLSLPVPDRLTRIISSETLTHPSLPHLPIPMGTHLSQSTLCTAMNPTLFPSPETFNPDHWLLPPSTGETRRTQLNKSLEKYQVAFSKGAGSCIGINLAYAEVYLAVAWVFHRFDLELVGTTEEDDVMPKHCFLLGVPRIGSEGVRGRLKGRRRREA